MQALQLSGHFTYPVWQRLACGQRGPDNRGCTVRRLLIFTEPAQTTKFSYSTKYFSRPIQLQLFSCVNESESDFKLSLKHNYCSYQENDDLPYVTKNTTLYLEYQSMYLGLPLLFYSFLQCLHLTFTPMGWHHGFLQLTITVAKLMLKGIVTRVPPCLSPFFPSVQLVEDTDSNSDYSLHVYH